ncbi:MAG: serine hydrolase domain-containing protein [Bryobacteraceae bacterium]
MLRRHFLAGLALALKRDRLDSAVALVEKFAQSGKVRAAALLVRQGDFELARGFGAAKADTVFLLASITKPMTAAGVMILRDRKQLSLDDTVRRYIPEFHGGDRDQITIRHLLTHTSGLPDMLPENTDLRRRHAPLKDFVAGACHTPLLFKPGSEVRYQSMGILLASEIAERITRKPFRDFLRAELFEPLGMRASSLDLGGRAIRDTAQSQVTGDDDWNWNSPYWRNLGVPWGGAHSNARDVAAFTEFFRNPRKAIFKPETAREMITNQNAGLKTPWGIGWMLRRFGKSCSAETYGHGGSTGTSTWHDPASGITCVILTTWPAAESQKPVLTPVCDLVSQAA